MTLLEQVAKMEQTYRLYDALDYTAGLLSSYALAQKKVAPDVLKVLTKLREVVEALEVVYDDLQEASDWRAKKRQHVVDNALTPMSES